MFYNIGYQFYSRDIVAFFEFCTETYASVYDIGLLIMVKYYFLIIFLIHSKHYCIDSEVLYTFGFSTLNGI